MGLPFADYKHVSGCYITVNENFGCGFNLWWYRLSFVAVGCTNLIPPEDAWIKREDDKIIIGCYTSRQTWQLRCHDGRWTGVVSNCSHDASQGNYTSMSFTGNIWCPCVAVIALTDMPVCGIITGPLNGPVFFCTLSSVGVIYRRL